MLNSYDGIRQNLKNGDMLTISVAVAQEKEVLRTVAKACEEGYAQAVLVGNRDHIEKILGEEGLSSPVSIIHETNEYEACLSAIKMIRTGEADLLMKGMVNSSVFLRSVLSEGKYSNNKGFLNHLAAFQVPHFDRLLFFSDGGMNIAPDLDGKKQIIINSVSALHRLGIYRPKVAVLTANEMIDPKVPATLDASSLYDMWQKNLFPDCILEGPVALDVALSKEAALHKGLKSEIAGETDLFIVPDIHAGNMIGKTLIYCAGAKMAGVILGASYPIVMTSRAENIEGKLNSIALAAALAAKNNKED